MTTVLASKPVHVRDAASYADDILCALAPVAGHDAVREHAPLLDKLSIDLIESQDADIMQFGFILGLQAVLETPAEALGEQLHRHARKLLGILGDGMPEIIYSMSPRQLVHLIPVAVAHHDQQLLGTHKRPAPRRRRGMRQPSLPTPRKYRD